MLIEEGRLEMDKPALRWLPELANRRVLRHLDGPSDEALPARRDITVRDLLAFTLGFGILFDNPPIQKRIDELQLVKAGCTIPVASCRGCWSSARRSRISMSSCASASPVRLAWTTPASLCRRKSSTASPVADISHVLLVTKRVWTRTV